MSDCAETAIFFILFFILIGVSIWVVITHGWAGFFFVAFVIGVFIILVGLFTKD